MPCLICGEPRTVRAHLLPRAFAHDARDGEKDLRIGVLGEPGFALTQSGNFDSDMLCETHERMLDPLDDYAVRFVRDFLQHREERSYEGYPYWIVRGIDSDLLVRFAASVIWRWSASNLAITRDVNLGAQEALFRTAVFDGADCSQAPQVGLYSLDSRTLGRETVRRLIIPPSALEPEGVQHWGFVVGGLVFLVKADERSIPLENGGLLAINGRTDYVGRESMIEDGPEYPAIAQMILDMGKKKPPRSR
jgi:hypothetical protein